MKTKFAILTLLFASQYASAQVENYSSSSSSGSSSVTTTTTETINTVATNSFYYGFSGGYLFKNNNAANNPMWYLNNGRFAELNLGNRNGVFGWSAALGYLTLSRDLSALDRIWINTQMAYDSGRVNARENKPSDIVSGLGGQSLYFDAESQETLISKPYRGFYFMTGPNIWIGKGKFQANIALEGGVGFSKVGYYYVKASGSSMGTATLTSQDSTGRPATYDMTAADLNYQQYGMSDKYYNKLAASSLTDPFQEKEPYELSFMGRLTANFEYFVTPKISLHGGASLWYIGTPQMNGTQKVSGMAVYSDSLTKHFSSFSYTDNYKKNDLIYVSANAGVKFWINNSGTKTKKTVVQESKQTEYEKLQQNTQTDVAKTDVAKAASKSIIVTVVDDLTSTPMGGVEVVLKGKNGQGDITTVTRENGTIELQNISAGDYEINGQIYNIATTSTLINASEFAGNSNVIHTTLLYKDARFILKGVAINTETGTVEEMVKVGLEKSGTNASNANTDAKGNFQFLLAANSDYTVQGLKNGFYSNIEQVSTVGLNRSQTLFVKLQLGMNTVSVGKSFVLDNILYDLDDATIRPDAAIELNRLVAFLNENKEVRILLSSHTDSRGSNKHNLDLSQRRAQSAVNYLASRGIDKGRLIAKGYGETRLLNKCADGVKCSEADHQKNRRTEIEIID